MSKARQAADEVNRQQAGRRNLIINGAMQVAQRATSKTGITSAGYYTCDRFKWSDSGAQATTQEQSTDAPDGFSNSWKVSVTTANSSIGQNEYGIVHQTVEAQNLQHLKYGTSSAQKLTMSFWVKSNKTGTYVLELHQHDAASLYYNSHQYTINSADTWEHKVITISGKTAHAINNDNGKGLDCYFWLAAGSAYSGGTYNEDTWHGTNADRAVGVVNIFDSTSNYWQITGVQLEVGDVATPFEHRSYGEELALCQRYYQKLDLAGGSVLLDGYYAAGNYMPWQCARSVVMRASPTTTVTKGTYTLNIDNDPTAGPHNSEHFVGAYARATATGRAYYMVDVITSDAEL